MFVQASAPEKIYKVAFHQAVASFFAVLLKDSRVNAMLLCEDSNYITTLF